jgi:hypothetical protein
MYPVFNSFGGIANTVAKDANKVVNGIKNQAQHTLRQRDFFELDSREFDELEALASRGLAGVAKTVATGATAAAKNLAGKAQRVAGAIKGRDNLENQQLQQRDVFELDSRDYDELEVLASRGLAGVAKTVATGATAAAKNLASKALIKGRANMENQQLQRDFFELDSRDFDELEARASHGLAGTILHHAGKLGPSIFENAASLGSQYMQGKQQPNSGQMMRRGANAAAGMAGAGAATAAPDTGATMDPSMGGASTAGGAGPSMGGAGGMGGPHKHGHKHGPKRGKRDDEEFWARRFVFSFLYRLAYTDISLHRPLSFYGDFDELD